MQPYIFYSILAAFSFALTGLANKFASKHKITNHWVLLFYSYLTFIPFHFFLLLFFKISLPTKGWIFIPLEGIVFFLGYTFFIIAIYKVDASTFAPFYQLQAAFVAILAFLFLGERFPATNYLLILLMLFGSFLVSLDEKMTIKAFFRLAILFIILQQLFHAFSNIFAGFAVKNMNSFTFMFWRGMFSLTFPLILAPFIGFSKLKVSFSQIRPLFIAGFFSLVGATSLYTAFQTNVTISSTLSLLTSPIVLILTIFASTFRPDLLEHHTKKVYLIRTIGVILILAAAVKLSV